MLRRFGVFFLFILACAAAALAADPVRIAIVTDVHAHDTNSPNEQKVMVHWPERVAAFVDAAESWPADVVISLGDYVNGTFVMGAELGDPARIFSILEEAYAQLASFDGPTHYVIGNHDVYSLSKDQILSVTGTETTYYSFDLGAIHVVILDAQFDKNEKDYANIAWMVQGLVPSAELEWLRSDLSASSLPTLVFIHQPLDSDFELLAGGPPIFNHLAVRAVLEQDGDVIAVFSGHDHDADYSQIGGIHYFTIAAMVDHLDPTPATWAMVTVDAEQRIVLVEGEGLQPDYEVAF